MTLETKIWLPSYMFVLYSMAVTYPKRPNDILKKKYYNFISDLPLFLPDKDISNIFSVIINKYPVSPYLDTRESFKKWLHFINNKLNRSIGLEDISMDEAMLIYYDHYKNKDIIKIEEKRRREKYIFVSFLLLITLIIFNIYSK